MQITKVFLTACCVGAVAGTLHAQSASPEAQRKALEVLRQTTGQGQTATHPISTSVATVGSPQQQQAIQVLRQTIANEQAVSTSPSATVSKAERKPAKASTSTSSKETTSTTGGSTINPKPVQPSAATTAATSLPAGATTKQQRLADLLDQYKADKITPAEYHTQRAKILSEP